MSSFLSSSILRRCVSRKAATINAPRGYVSPQRTLSTVVSSNNNNINTLPWLMLPPDYNKMVYKFYSLSENKVLNIDSTNVKSFVGLSSDDIPGLQFVSSCHGWLALFNPTNCDLFLYNPITGRHIKLPPIYLTLDIPKGNMKHGTGCMKKLLISCSPEQEDCRVILTYGPERRLAFCSPNSSEPMWIPIGRLFQVHPEHRIVARVYQNFVYSSQRKLFYCVTKRGELEAWDLRDDQSPKVTPIEFSFDKETYPWAAPWSKEDLELKKKCSSTPLKHLVLVDDDLFLVVQHVMIAMSSDGSYFEDKPNEHAALQLPHKTIGFDVHKYDKETRSLTYMDKGSLDGLAFFIGKNNSFTISEGSDYSGVIKPNSIYFTDASDYNPPETVRRYRHGGHDLGIFDYRDRTFSPCYYPCDRKSIKRIIPAPLWFTPTDY